MNIKNDYAKYKNTIKEDLDSRIFEYKARFARRKMMLLATDVGGPIPLNLIAQGDSWFDYPLPILSSSDVVAHLRAMPFPPLILCLAHHGEAAESMLGVQKLHRLIEQLVGGDDNNHFDAILFSGGGNDLAGDQFRLWINDATKPPDPLLGLQQMRVDGILEVVRSAYQDLILARDKVASRLNRPIPIFVHSYDFAIPTGQGVCGAGPWLKPGLDDRGWDIANGEAIVKQILIQFAEMLDNFQAHAADFIHVKTQGLLNKNQWANELHPTPEGFSVIAAQFVASLRGVFGNRI